MNADALDTASAVPPQVSANQGDTLAKLAAALVNLSPADRAKLAAMLAESQGGQK